MTDKEVSVKYLTDEVAKKAAEIYEAVEDIMKEVPFWREVSIVSKNKIDTDRLERQSCNHYYFDHKYVDQSGRFVYLPATSRGFYIKIEITKTGIKRKKRQWVWL